MLNWFKTKVANVARQAAKDELNGKSVTYVSARAKFQTYDMRLAQLETNLLVRLDEIEQRLERLEKAAAKDDA